MFKAAAAGKPIDYTGFFADAHWWLFCFLILALNFLLIAFDPLPKLFLGDSGSYLWTALTGWIPGDRSFLYGYVIRWSSLWTGSLTSLLILQAFLGAVTAILVVLICRWIFGLASGLSYLFGLLCSLDPMQLVWQRYVMTETISLFFYILMLLFSFLYLKERRLWQLAIFQILSVLVISFRMSYLLVVQISGFLLPIIAFLPEIRAAFRKHCSTLWRMSVMRSTGLHLALSILLMFVLQQGYQQLNGRLAHREPGYLYEGGFLVLAAWAPALKPSDSPDLRLSELIAEGDQFQLNDILLRHDQLYSPGHLIQRWIDIEPNAIISNQVAKQTAVHALLRRPMGIATLGAKTYLMYWDFSLIRRRAKGDLGSAVDWPKEMALDSERGKWVQIATHFRLSPPRPEDAKAYTLLERYFLRSPPYYYVVLLSPFLCGCLIFFVCEGCVLLLFLHSWILLGTECFLHVHPSLRHIQPMSLLTILIFAVLVKRVADRRLRPTSAAAR
jgi:hypothetical protein